jgi:hypothetical protein
MSDETRGVETEAEGEARPLVSGLSPLLAHRAQRSKTAMSQRRPPRYLSEVGLRIHSSANPALRRPSVRVGMSSACSRNHLMENFAEERIL